MLTYTGLTYTSTVEVDVSDGLTPNKVDFKFSDEGAKQGLSQDCRLSILLQFYCNTCFRAMNTYAKLIGYT